MDVAKSGEGNGVVKLPIGFRFHPTDEELVLHYLKRKVFSLPLPATVIPELEDFHSNPWDLPGESKEKRYFFCKRRWNCRRLGSDCGYWRGSGKEKQITAPGSNLVVGIRKSFVFYQRRKLKTRWIMHQFCLVGSINAPYSTQKLTMQVGDWVVCRLYERKTRARNEQRRTGLTARGPPNQASPSSCCSGITEVSGDELDEEASSCGFR